MATPQGLAVDRTFSSNTPPHRESGHASRSTFNLEGLDNSPSLGYLEDFNDRLSRSGNGKMTIRVCESGQVKARRYSVGLARKEPDTVFHIGDGIPTLDQQPLHPEVERLASDNI
ncbi:unnamed protein product [Sympodiomycopsis kandeliae]